MAFTALEGAAVHTGTEWLDFLTGAATGGRDGLVVGVDEPTASNTGVYPGTELTEWPNSYTISAGATIEDYSFPDGRVTINTTETVTFRNCLFNADGFVVAAALVRSWAAQTADAWFYDCTFEPTWPAHTTETHGGGIAGASGHGMRFVRCKFLACVDGVTCFDSDINVADMLIQQCYFDEFAFWRPTSGQAEGVHPDGIAIAGGDDIQVLGNAIWGYVSPTIGDGAGEEGTAGYAAGHGVESEYWTSDDRGWINTSCIFMKPDNDDISGVVIDGNWLYGSTVPIHASDVGGTPQPDLIVTDNRFGNPGTVDAGQLDKPAEFGNAATTRSNATVTGNTYLNGSDADADI